MKHFAILPFFVTMIAVMGCDGDDTLVGTDIRSEERPQVYEARYYPESTSWTAVEHICRAEWIDQTTGIPSRSLLAIDTYTVSADTMLREGRCYRRLRNDVLLSAREVQDVEIVNDGTLAARVRVDDTEHMEYRGTATVRRRDGGLCDVRIADDSKYGIRESGDSIFFYINATNGTGYELQAYDFDWSDAADEPQVILGCYHVGVREGVKTWPMLDGREYEYVERVMDAGIGPIFFEYGKEPSWREVMSFRRGGKEVYRSDALFGEYGELMESLMDM